MKSVDNHYVAKCFNTHITWLLLLCGITMAGAHHAAYAEDFAEFVDEQTLLAEPQNSLPDNFLLEDDRPQMTDENGQPMELVPNDFDDAVEDTTITQP